MALTLAHEVWGTGERPVLFLHGFTGARSAWDGLRSRLGASLRAIAVDLPGHGDSPLPTRAGRDGFEETLTALTDVLARVGAPESVDVIGYSQGARIALGWAVRHPERVHRLVLESVNPGLKRGQERSARRAQDELLARSIETDGVPDFVRRWEALPLFAGVRRLPEPEQAALRARRGAGTAEGLAGALRCLGLGVQPSYWPALPTLRVPTLLLTGAEDARFSDLARRMSAELPMCWRRAIPGCGHAPHLEATDVYAEELLAFLGAPESNTIEKFGT